MKVGARAILLLCLLTPFAAAQKPRAATKTSPTSPDQLISLKAKGTTRYNDKEILAASRLELGQKAADGDFKEALQRLGSSGMFSDLSYSYTSSASGIKLELQLPDIDASKLVPVVFDNFVWFTDAELQSALQTQVPLFRQVLPLTGSLPDRIQEALQAMINQKQIPGRVDYLREAADQNGGPLTGFVYRVEEVSIQIHGVEFPGASTEQAELLSKASRRIIGQTYDRSSIAAVAKLDLLPVYLKRGYLRATFNPSDARVMTKPTDADSKDANSDIEVDAIIPVIPGKVYSVSEIDWKGNSVIATNELTPLLHLTLGAPADAVHLTEDLDTIAHLYHSRGYMMADIKPDAKIDDAQNTVHYDLNVTEGDLYKMGEIEVTGLDTQAKARMIAAWKLRQGQPFNADYPKKFMEDTRQMLPGGAGWESVIHVTPDPKDKTVDVEIHFKQQ